MAPVSDDERGVTPAVSVNRIFRGQADAPSPPRANRGRQRDRRLWATACRSARRPSCRLAGGRRPLFAPSRTRARTGSSSAQAALGPSPRSPAGRSPQLAPRAPPFSPSARLTPLSPGGAAAQARRGAGRGGLPGPRAGAVSVTRTGAPRFGEALAGMIGGGMVARG